MLKRIWRRLFKKQQIIQSFEIPKEIIPIRKLRCVKLLDERIFELTLGVEKQQIVERFQKDMEKELFNELRPAIIWDKREVEPGIIRYEAILFVGVKEKSY